VTGVQQDKDAVLAGLTLPWSNGPVEGQVNRLKLIKRSMYGRAKFDLLKLRVLHHDKKSLERKNKKKQAQQEDYLKTPRVRKKNTTAICRIKNTVCQILCDEASRFQQMASAS
jgi:hypothetical protein